MGTSVSTPQPRNYSNEISTTLADQINLAPALYSAEAQYQPLYNLLGLSNLQDYMLGTQGGTRQVRNDIAESTMALRDAQARGLVTKSATGGAGSNTLGTLFTGGLLGGSSPQKTWQLTDLGKQQGYQISGKALYRPASSGVKDVTIPNQRGLLDLYENSIYPAMSRIENQNADERRAADLGALQKYGSSYTDALLAANPAQKAILDEMNRQAMTDLQAGQSLTPDEIRQSQQASRAAFSARGLGLGNQAIADEIFKRYQLGTQRQQQRRAFAAGVFDMNKAATGDPMLQILGRPSQMLPYGQGLAAQGMNGISNLGSTLFNPESQYAGDIYNQSYQAKMAASAANSANNAALIGAGIQGLGSLGGGYLGMR